MNIDFINAVIGGRHADVGAPAPMLDDAARARATRRLLDLSPCGDPGPMLLALGLRVEEIQLPERAPMALAHDTLLVAASSPPLLHVLFVLAGLAIASLRFEAAAHSLADVWLVVALLVAQ